MCGLCASLPRSLLSPLVRMVRFALFYAACVDETAVFIQQWLVVTSTPKRGFLRATKVHCQKASQTPETHGRCFTKKVCKHDYSLAKLYSVPAVLKAYTTSNQYSLTAELLCSPNQNSKVRHCSHARLTSPQNRFSLRLHPLWVGFLTVHGRDG